MLKSVILRHERRFNVLYETCIGQLQFGWLVYWIIVFNVTFNNISVISWWSVLLVEETGVPRENPPTCRKSLSNYHIMLYRVHLAMNGVRTNNFGGDMH
jgi:hypothetical protein